MAPSSSRLFGIDDSERNNSRVNLKTDVLLVYENYGRGIVKGDMSEKIEDSN